MFSVIQRLSLVFSLFVLLGSFPAHATPLKDRVGVIITNWGMPAGYNFEYAWNSHDNARIGDRTQYPGQPCKIGHVGQFPYQSHFGIFPWALTVSWPGGDLIYDNSGLYKLENNVYIGVHQDIPSLTPDIIPKGVPIVPVVQVKNPMTKKLRYPPDPRTGEDHLAGWYKIGSIQKPFPNGVGDLYEAGPLRFMLYYGVIGEITELPQAYHEAESARESFTITGELLKESFGDKIEFRYGVYNKVSGYSEHETDVAEDLANKGIRKMVLARETTDNNHYANKFFTGNYIRERLCEIGVLDEMEINQTRQVGRTPEFNALNILNLKNFIEAYPEGTKIGLIYVTRGLPWGMKESSGLMGTQHPWSREVYHENAYLNYLSWKQALRTAYGDRYKLVFTRNGIESDLMKDNFYSYGLSQGKELGNHFSSIRDTIQSAKNDGLDKIIVVPCHWSYDSLDNIYLMRAYNGIPLNKKSDIAAQKFDLTYCEDAQGNVVSCEAQNAVATITAAPSYSKYPRQFAIAYAAVLRGTLERFGLYPKEVSIKIEASQPITKRSGGVVEVIRPQSLIKGAKIIIPADPYPDRPEAFTRQTAIPVNDPGDTNDCLWEDTVITLGHQINPPPMKIAGPIGPAVHVGPYRNFFNRDITIAIPYDNSLASDKAINVYVYNHVTGDWDKIPVDSTTRDLVLFKTKVLGLFRAGAELKTR